MYLRFVDVPRGVHFFDCAGELYRKVNASNGRSCDGERATVSFQGNEVMSVDSSELQDADLSNALPVHKCDECNHLYARATQAACPRCTKQETYL